jgi:hypothetical protein
VHERSLFFVTPLVLACVAHWVAAGAPASRRALLLCCTATLLALASLTAPLIRRSSDLDAPAIVPLERMLASHPSVPAQAWIIGAGLIACAVLVLARRTPAPLFAAAFGTLIAAGSLVWADDLTPSELRRFGWVDGALPPGATATLLHVDLPVDRRAPCAEAAEYEQQGLALWTEFLNDRIDRVYHLYGDLGRAAVASPELRLAKQQGILLTRDGRSIGPDYVVVDSRETLAGTRLRRFEPGSAGVPFGEEGSSLTLWRSEKPLRVGPRHFPAPPRADGRSCQASSTRNRSSNSSSKPSPRRRGRDIALARVTTDGVRRAEGDERPVGTAAARPREHRAAVQDRAVGREGRGRGTGRRALHVREVADEARVLQLRRTFPVDPLELGRKPFEPAEDLVRDLDVRLEVLDGLDTPHLHPRNGAELSPEHHRRGAASLVLAKPELEQALGDVGGCRDGRGLPRRRPGTDALADVRQRRLDVVEPQPLHRRLGRPDEEEEPLVVEQALVGGEWVVEGRGLRERGGVGHRQPPVAPL